MQVNNGVIRVIGDFEMKQLGVTKWVSLTCFSPPYPWLPKTSWI